MDKIQDISEGSKSKQGLINGQILNIQKTISKIALDKEGATTTLSQARPLEKSHKSIK